MTAGREWLRFFDNPLVIGGFQVPLFRTGFRMVIFSLILMAVVLYYRKGLMGTREFSWNGMYAFAQKHVLKRNKTPIPAESDTEDSATSERGCSK